MHTCLSICIPEEIWIMIVGNSGPILQTLFTVNKRINMYLEKIKHNFISYRILYRYYECHNTENTKTITVVKNDNTCNIKYDGNLHILNVNFWDNPSFMIEENLKILLVYSAYVIKYSIYDKILYDMEKCVITNENLNKKQKKLNERLNKKNKSMNDLINKICNLTHCGPEIAKFALIYCNFDVRNSLRFVSPGYRHLK